MTHFWALYVSLVFCLCVRGCTECHFLEKQRCHLFVPHGFAVVSGLPHLCPATFLTLLFRPTGTASLYIHCLLSSASFQWCLLILYLPLLILLLILAYCVSQVPYQSSTTTVQWALCAGRKIQVCARLVSLQYSSMCCISSMFYHKHTWSCNALDRS